MECYGGEENVRHNRDGMKTHAGSSISMDTIRTIIERNDLRDLKKLFYATCIGEISQPTREFYFTNYLKSLTADKTASNIEWAISGQIIDSILTHPEYRNRVKRKPCVTQGLEEVN